MLKQFKEKSKFGRKSIVRELEGAMREHNQIAGKIRNNKKVKRFNRRFL